MFLYLFNITQLINHICIAEQEPINLLAKDELFLSQWGISPQEMKDSARVALAQCLGNTTVDLRNQVLLNIMEGRWRIRMANGTQPLALLTFDRNGLIDDRNRLVHTGQILTHTRVFDCVIKTASYPAFLAEVHNAEMVARTQSRGKLKNLVQPLYWSDAAQPVVCYAKAMLDGQRAPNLGTLIIDNKYPFSRLGLCLHAGNTLCDLHNEGLVHGDLNKYQYCVVSRDPSNKNPTVLIDLETLMTRDLPIFLVNQNGQLWFAQQSGPHKTLLNRSINRLFYDLNELYDHTNSEDVIPFTFVQGADIRAYALSLFEEFAKGYMLSGYLLNQHPDLSEWDDKILELGQAITQKIKNKRERRLLLQIVKIIDQLYRLPENVKAFPNLLHSLTQVHSALTVTDRVHLLSDL